MDIQGVPFTVVDWNQMEKTVYPGASGTATWRIFEMGNIRVRMVEYSAGYEADDWCDRGHVLLVYEGELISERQDGTINVLKAGMSYQTSDDPDNMHRSRTKVGAKLYIVD